MCPSNPFLNFLCQVVTLRGVFSWSVVGNFLFRDFVFVGIGVTVCLAVAAQLIGSLIGLLLYFMRRSRALPLRWLANFYIWVFRGTPLILQIVLLYEGLGQVGLGRILAEHYLSFLGGNIKIYADSVLAGLFALSFNEGAYMAEIVRAGIDSIDVGQMEAAKSLGMTYLMAMRRVVLPQAMRVIVPPLGNEFNGMLKNTSLANYAALTELFYLTSNTANSTNRFLELYTVAAIWYLAMTTVWGFIQASIERRLNVSSLDPDASTRGYLSRVFGFGGRETPLAGAPVEPSAGAIGDHPR
jgi:polar amino acid transport system permease protein